MTISESTILWKLILKYQTYISNLEWHIRTNKPVDTTVIDKQLECYKEIVKDLKLFAK